MTFRGEPRTRSVSGNGCARIKGVSGTGRPTVSHERTAAVFYRLLVVTKLDKMSADRIEGTSLSPRVSDGTVESQRLPGLNHRFEPAILRLQDIGAAETDQRAKLTVTVPPRDLDGLIQMITGADNITKQES